MKYIGEVVIGESFPYGEQFHDDNGAAADPTSPSARICKGGVWSDLSGDEVPAKLNSVTGLYGASVNTSGFSAGVCLIRLIGTVSGHEVAAEFIVNVVSSIDLTTASTYYWAGNFHSLAANTPVDPDSETEAYTVYDCDCAEYATGTPTKLDSKTGHYGAAVDVSSYDDGVYMVHLTGQLSTVVIGTTAFFTVRSAYTRVAVPCPVNHNTGGADALAYKTGGGVGVSDVTVTAYLTTDYVAGRTSAKYIRGQSVTDSNGRWTAPMFLDTGAYTLVYHKHGSYGPDTQTLSVTSITMPRVGSGSNTVTTDSGGIDNLRCINEHGMGEDNMYLYAFLTSDFSAGNVAEAYIKGFTMTKGDGRLQTSMLLATGAYTLCYVKQGKYKTVTKTLTVS